MDVIPAIDLLEGRCVRLYQGDYQQAQVFSEDPVTMALQWQTQGATRLHVVDLDGAKAGHPVNQTVIRSIAEALDIPVQVGGGLRDLASVSQLLNFGVDRVILGTVAVENPELIKVCCSECPGQIIVGIDARDGQVATKGWLETSSIAAVDLAQQMSQLGVVAIIYTDIQRDGTLKGPNLGAMRELASQISIPVIASGGVSSITDLLSLLALEPLGVTGAIVGKALYMGNVQLAEALKAVGAGRWQDVPPNLGNALA
jgi:phosphoribosylformimino-5-aminoimidazole carboxamide ribotide isomerase